MYNLHLSPEQLEIRDTVRDFVTREIKPVALKAERLDLGDRSLLTGLLDQASQMGLRSLALSEERGGAGADALTACIVTEELAAGDADIAAVLSESSRLAHLLFDRAMSDAQRDALLPKFMGGDRYHLAFAGHEGGTDTRLGVNYHRPASAAAAVKTSAVKSGGEPFGETAFRGGEIGVGDAHRLEPEFAPPGLDGAGEQGVIVICCCFVHGSS